jgi:hypothetical protein
MSGAFSDPKNPVKYVGLNPAFDDSGASKWSGGVGHGRRDLRGLLVEGAHAILRSARTPPGPVGPETAGAQGRTQRCLSYYMFATGWKACNIASTILIKVGI